MTVGFLYYVELKNQLSFKLIVKDCPWTETGEQLTLQMLKL